MSVVRIDSQRTHGWQARWPADGKPNGLSMLCSDGVHGGREKAYRVAKAAEQLLKLQAQAIRRQRVLAGLEQLLPNAARNP